MSTNIEQAGGSLGPAKAKGAWGILAIIWLAYFAQPLNTVKASVLAEPLMEYFAMSEATLGWCFSLFYIIGFVLAFPTAAIIAKLGLKKTGIISLVCATIGGIIGALAPNLAVFMVSRFVEGVGMGLFGVVGVAAITPWFAPSRRGTPMALWGMAVTIAFLVGPIGCTYMYEAIGSWQGIWWIVIIFTVIVGVLFIIFYHEPDFGFDANEQIVPISEAQIEEVHDANLGAVLKTPMVWIIGIMMFLVCAASMALENFFPTYVYSCGFSLTAAGWITSGGAITGAICAFVAGFVSDKIHSRRIIMLIGFIGAVVYAILLFRTTTVSMFLIVLWILGIGENFTIAMFYSTISETTPPEKLNGASAMLVFMMNLGQFVGTTAIGYVFTGVGSWSLAALIVPVPLYAIGLIMTIIFWKKLP